MAGIEIAAASLGILMGCLYVLIPVKETGTEEFARNPRVRNLLFVFSPVALLFGSWEKAGLEFNHQAVFVSYISSIGPTILLLFLIFSVGIYFDRRRRRRHDRERFADLNFTHWAWMFVINPARYDREVRAERDAVEQHRKDLEEGQIGRVAAARETLGILIKSVGVCSETRETHRHQQLTDSLLEAIESVALFMTRTPQHVSIHANYMQVVPIGRATAPEKSAVKFEWPDRSKWTHLLVLRRYVGRNPIYPFALAVAEGSSPDELLLGAPEAYVRGQATYVDRRRLQFARRVPRSIQTAVTAYLKEISFVTFVSIPIVHASGIVGIVNIESNQPFIVGESEEVLNLATRYAAPYCSLLGQLLADTRTRL
jgi:hypothetical protein